MRQIAQETALADARQALNNALKDHPFVGDPLEGYLASKARKVSPNYLHDQSIVLTAVIRDLGGITSALESSSRTLELWRDRKLSSVKPVTVGAYLIAFKMFLEWCRKEGIVETNAANLVELPRYRKPFRKVVGSAEMVRILIEECDDPDLEYILYAGFHAGMRKGEIAASRPSWFDLEQGMVNITRSDDFDTKDGEDRSVPLTRGFAAYLQVYQVRGEFMLFNNHSKPGQRYRYEFRAKFQKYMALKCKEHGFIRLTVHDMRRTFASLIASSRSLSMYELARWLGDGLDVVIKHYGHLQPHNHEIDDAFGPRRGQNGTMPSTLTSE
jgi:integrase